MAGAGRSVTAFRISPGELYGVEIPGGEAGARDRAHGLLRVILGKPDPHHGMAAIFDDDAAHFRQIRRLIGRVQQGLVVAAEGVQDAIQFTQLLLLLVCAR